MPTTQLASPSVCCPGQTTTSPVLASLAHATDLHRPARIELTWDGAIPRGAALDPMEPTGGRHFWWDDECVVMAGSDLVARAGQARYPA